MSDVDIWLRFSQDQLRDRLTLNSNVAILRRQIFRVYGKCQRRIYGNRLEDGRVHEILSSRHVVCAGGFPHVDAERATLHGNGVEPNADLMYISFAARRHRGLILEPMIRSRATLAQIEDPIEMPGDPIRIYTFFVYFSIFFHFFHIFLIFLLSILRIFMYSLYICIFCSFVDYTLKSSTAKLFLATFNASEGNS